MTSAVDTVLRAVTRPSTVLSRAWRAVPLGSFKLRLDYDAFRRPHYAFCAYHAARLADLLGIERISLIEFGVAGGQGLLELEDLADELEQEFSTRIEIYGFDTGAGLPEPVDYRDIPYVWRAGFYAMDQAALRRRLRRTTLVIGDAAETVRTFAAEYRPAPIGAVFYDLDYYSSTLAAMQLMHGDAQTMLPRVFSYFDDVGSVEGAKVMCDRVGQLLSIREFNEMRETRHVAPVAGLPSSRRIRTGWAEQIYVHHAFDHPDYTTYALEEQNRQLPLD